MTDATILTGERPALYDRDFHAWAEAQAAALRRAAARDTISGEAAIDWDNLIEEVESLGRSELDKARSGLMRIIEHLLKLEYAPAEGPRQGWRESVVNHRVPVLDTLERSPSLRGRIRPELEAAFRNGRRLAGVGLERDGLNEAALPAACPYTLAQLLDHDWWPVSRHGFRR